MSRTGVSRSGTFALSERVRRVNAHCFLTDFSDSDPDWEENFSLLSNTLCPAVLTENFFMDSRSDLEYLQSRAGKQAVVDTHVEGIMEWLEMN